MREIGGFFPLELNRQNFYSCYEKSLAFNSGSSALLFFLNHNNLKNVYVPYFTCKNVIETVEKARKNIIFYNLLDSLKPNLDANLFRENDLLVYNNYFGLNLENVEIVQKQYNNVIIDSAQSFFYKPPKAFNAFNSIRKFFGVPDGGFLLTKAGSEMVLDYNKLKRTPYNVSHLINRLEYGAQEAYSLFQESEQLISDYQVGKVSRLTTHIMASIDLEFIKKRRISNFKTLHAKLKAFNKFHISNNLDGQVPMCYPLLIDNGENLKRHLIKLNIFVPTYWPDISHTFIAKCKLEYNLVQNLVCLPIDQRYSIKEMNYMLELVENFLNE